MWVHSMLRVISSTHVLVITTNVNVYWAINQGTQHVLPMHFETLSAEKAKFPSTNEHF